MPEGSSIEIATKSADQGLKEAEPVKEHPLEGGILVHGFSGNIKKPEDTTVVEVITRGALVSPSRRSLDYVELSRFTTGIPRDYRRISFYCWKNNERKVPTYIDAAFWAGPINSLENYYIGRDATSLDAIYALGKDGVEISLDRGLLFISEDLLFSPEVWTNVEARAKEEHVTPKDIVSKYMVLLPAKLFPKLLPPIVNSYENDIELIDQRHSDRANQLLREIQRRITPAKGVTADFEEYAQVSNTDVMKKNAPATRKTLGTSTKLEGSLFSGALMDEWNLIYEHQRNKLDELIAEMEENPYRIEELYEPRSGWEWNLIHVGHRLEILDPDSELLKKIKEAEQKAQEALVRNQQILEQRFPNMPTYEGGPEVESVWRQTEVIVYRDSKTGNVKVCDPTKLVA